MTSLTEVGLTSIYSVSRALGLKIPFLERVTKEWVLETKGAIGKGSRVVGICGES